MTPRLPGAACALIPIDDGDTHDPWAGVAFLRAHVGRFGARVMAIVAGAAPDDAIGDEALRAGADDVWLVAHGVVALPVSTDVLVDVLARAIVQPGVVPGSHEGGLFLLPAGAVGEEVAARLAARLDGVPLGRCLAVEPGPQGLTVRRAAFGGRVHASLAAVAGPWFGVVRRPEISAPAGVREAPSVQRMQIEVAPAQGGFVRHSAVERREAPLAGARVVVAGGRGMGGEPGFARLRELAQCLDAAVGGSLPTVDAGWMPVTHQIGQSGKYVTPELYLAVGISGTPQHMAGLGPQVRVAAINKDAGAAIFRNAEIGLVGDWREALPALIERLQSIATNGRKA